MQFKRIGAIYRKEMLDLVRDRRTMISMVVMPVVLVPVLMLVGGRAVEMLKKKSQDEAKSLTVAVKGLTPEVEAALRGAGVNVVAAAEDVKAGIESKKSLAGVEQSGASLRIFTDSSNPSSASMGDKIRVALNELKDSQVRESLRSRGVPESVLTPFTVQRVNVASERKMAGAMWGTMLGYLLLLLMFSGGMYPVIDMTAGEKERKTLETFLSSPAGRDEIVLGKILAAVTAIAMTAALTLGSIVVSLRSNRLASRSDEFKAMFRTIPLDANALSLIALTLAPLIVFAASVMIAIAMFARSFKEGQSYLTPLMLFVLFPALLGGLPGLELTPMLCLIPIFNASQIIRTILLGEFPLNAFLITLAANMAYAAVAFVVAKRRFEDESVLFRN